MSPARPGADPTDPEGRQRGGGPTDPAAREGGGDPTDPDGRERGGDPTDPAAPDGDGRPGSSAAAALARTLLLLYPPSFRREVGRHVVADVRRRAEDMSAVRGKARLLLWLLRLGASFVANAFAAWREELGPGRRSGPPGRLRRGVRDGGGASSLLRPRPGRGFAVSWIDVKLGLRMLKKHPGFAIIGGFGIAVAIAVSGGLFAFAQAHFYPDIPLDEGHRMVGLENWDLARNNEERRSLWDFAVWREEMETVEDMTAFTTVGRSLIMGDGPSELVRVAKITPSGFRMARVAPLMGRTLVEEDAEPGAPPVVVVGHDVWRARFASDPGIVGREVRLGREVHTVVGVMPEGFHFPFNHSYWTALGVAPGEYDRGEGPYVYISGRLVPGHTLDDARAELTVIGERMAARFPDTHGDYRAQVMPYAYPLLDVNQSGGKGLGLEIAAINAFVALLLLVVSFNVAILVYARTATRRGEIAVRTALGASRGRIVVQLFVEALVLSGAAALAGLGLIRLGLALGNRILELEVARLPFWMDLGIPGAAMAYVAGLAVLAAVIIGVLPGLQATSSRIQRNITRFHQASGPGLGRVWTTLVVLQVALAVGAVPTAAAMAWWEVGRGLRSPSFPVEEFLAVPMASDVAAEDETDDERRVRLDELADFRTELVRRLMPEPGVVGWALSGHLRGSPARVELEGAAAAADPVGPHSVRAQPIGPDFFHTFDARIVAGRDFRAADGEEGARDVIVVNETFVRRFLGGGDALEQRVRFLPPPGEADPDGEADEAPWLRIVGVAEDLHTWPAGERFADATIYRPVNARNTAGAVLVVRTAGPAPETLPGRIRELATAIDPTYRINVVEMTRSYGQERIALALVGLVLGLAVASVLLLSAGGIYALGSFTVSQRRREIGIRRALGARPGRLLAGVFRAALARLAVGVVLGVAAAAAYDHQTGGDLFQGHTELALSAMVLIISGVTVLAALGPARRGLSIEPARVLQEE